MNIQILKKLEENIKYFNTDIFLLGKIKGCSESEIKDFNTFYNNKVPQMIKELLFLGGYNFFDYYFELEYVTGYRLWQSLITAEIHYQEFKSVPFEILKYNQKDRIYLTACECSYLYILLKDGEDPAVYELLYIDEPKVSMKYDSLSKLIDIVIDDQIIKYSKFQERLRLGIDEFTLEAQREIERNKTSFNPNSLPF